MDSDCKIVNNVNSPFSSDPYPADRATEHKWNTRQYNQTQQPPQDVVQPAESSADQRTERLGGYSTGYGSSVSVSEDRGGVFNLS